MDASKQKQKLRKLVGEQLRQIKIIVGQKALVKGTIFLMETKCGKKGCKCARKGELHKAWCICYSEAGKGKVRTLSKEKVLKYKKLTGNYRRFRQARAQIVKLHKAQIETINNIESALSQNRRKR